VDHEIDVKCKVYESGRVAADPETLRQLVGFSEREIEEGTGVHRSRIRLLRHGGTVTQRTYKKIMPFLKEHARPSAGLAHSSRPHSYGPALYRRQNSWC
jgi:hypothetical protein